MAYERFPTWAGAGTYITTLTASASANTKGAYSQIAASTGADCSDWQIQMGAQTAVRAMLTDIAIGAGGAEVVQVANILTETGNDAGGVSGTVIVVTSDVPASSRIAGRTQGSTGSASTGVAIVLNEAGLAGRALPVTYGVNNSTSFGSSIDPGATINTKGAYTQVTASTSSATTLLTVDTQFDTNQTPSFCAWALDIATGAGGAEVVVIPNLLHQSDDLGGDMALPQSQTFSLSLASSTRVAARSACEINAATRRLLDISLIAAVAPATTGTSGGSWAFA